MSLNLPSVINTIVSPPSVPSVLPADSHLPSSKRFVILHTIPISEQDLANFRGHGKVVQYNYAIESTHNVDLLQFDYLFIDLCDQASRAYYDSQNLSNYNVICYCHNLEQFDRYIESLEVSNVLTEFPLPTHFKNSFDASLLKNSTPAPNNRCLSALNYGCSFLDSVKKQGRRSS